MASSQKVLITGAAGFIGFHLTQKLCDQGYNVTGLDNLNSYYDVNLKQSRLSILKKRSNFDFHKIDLADGKGLNDLFSASKFTYVVNLAAQAGVRYSITNPMAY